MLGNDLPPLLTRLDPFLAQLDPILTGVRRYRHEVTAFLGNVSAALNGFNAPPKPTDSTFATSVRPLHSSPPSSPPIRTG